MPLIDISPIKKRAWHTAVISALTSVIAFTVCPNAQAGAPPDQKGKQAAERMAKFYSGLNSLSYTVSTTIETKQGNSVEKRDAKYEIKQLKPACLAIDVDRGKNENKTLERLNENKLTVYLPTKGYMNLKADSMPLPFRIQADIAAVTSKELTLFGFLGIVCATEPMQTLTMCKPFRPENIAFIGNEKIGPLSTQHLQLVSAPQVGLKWDIWIQDGDKPFVCRSLTKLNNAKDKFSLEVKSDFSNWRDNPKLTAADFNFVPPPGAREIKSPTDAGGSPAAQLEGKMAPPVKLSTIDGKIFDLAASKGKQVVVLDFWATWCGPCREALPILADVTSKYASKGVLFYGIDCREDPGQVKQFLKDHNLKINCAIDKDGKVQAAYMARGIPQTVIIGKDGKVKLVHIGFMDDLKERLPKELDAVLHN